MRTTKLTLMKPVVEINIDAELIEDKIAPLNKGGKLHVIKCMFGNLRTMAKMIGYTRLDIANAINAILKGESVDLKRLGLRYVVGFFDEKKSIRPDCDGGWNASVMEGHGMVTYDNATGIMELCGTGERVDLRADDIDVTDADRVPHGIPIDYNDYSDAQLLTIINHLFMNIRALATTLEDVRNDITVVLDSIATEYDNAAVEMSFADIGSSCQFTTMIRFQGIYYAYVVLDRRNNHFYLYAMRNIDPSTKYMQTLFPNGMPDDHMDMPIHTRALFAPAVQPTQKLIDRLKKKPFKPFITR